MNRAESALWDEPPRHRPPKPGPTRAELRTLLEQLRGLRTHMSLSPQSWPIDAPATADRLVEIATDRLRE